MSWQVGGYATESEKPFDQGSFGTVWRARRVSDDARVALKLVLLTDAADSRERIAAERHGAMLQQRFQQAHGMVPTVYDFGYDADESLFIAMELVEGGALTDLIKTAPVDPNVAAGYAIRICEFLDKAHSFATTVEGEPYHRLVHADLKPSHLLVGPSGDVKVLDFGIAKALAKTTQVTTNNWGTSAYASPERLEHGHVNEHVDFWSLGVILYEMLAGHRPYPGLERNPSQLERAIRGNAPRAPLPASLPRGTGGDRQQDAGLSDRASIPDSRRDQVRPPAVPRWPGAARHERLRHAGHDADRRGPSRRSPSRPLA